MGLHWRQLARADNRGRLGDILVTNSLDRTGFPTLRHHESGIPLGQGGVNANAIPGTGPRREPSKTVVPL